MKKRKIDLRGYFTGLKSLLTLNAILIIIINIMNQYSNNMKNAVRTLYAVDDIGVTAAIVGTAISVFLVFSIISRVPFGALTDLLRKKLKYILAIALVLKAVVWMCFPLATNETSLFIIFAIDGIVSNFGGTVLPAMMALSVDHRAIGSSYAVMMSITNIVVAPARVNAITLYDTSGIMAALGVGAAISVVAAVLALFMNSNKLLNNALVQNAKDSKATQKKKKGLLAGVSVKMIPFAIVAAMPLVLFTGETSFAQLSAAEHGFEYLTATTVGGIAHGIMTLVGGILCDLFNPSLIVIIALAGQAAAPFLMGLATDSAMFSAGIFLNYLTRFQGTALRIVGMKSVARGDQGALQATMLFFNDGFSMIASALIGVVATAFGYSTMWICMGWFLVVALVAFIVLDNTIMKKMRREAEAEAEAEEAAEAAQKAQASA